jgi:hypothetical protein
VLSEGIRGGVGGPERRHACCVRALCWPPRALDGEIRFPAARERHAPPAGPSTHAPTTPHCPALRELPAGTLCTPRRAARRRSRRHASASSSTVAAVAAVAVRPSPRRSVPDHAPCHRRHHPGPAPRLVRPPLRVSWASSGRSFAPGACDAPAAHPPPRASPPPAQSLEADATREAHASAGRARDAASSAENRAQRALGPRSLDRCVGRGDGCAADGPASPASSADALTPFFSPPGPPGGPACPPVG